MPVIELPLAFIGNLKGPDLLIIAFFALLIFGRRLPEIGKNIGRSVVEFKKGLKAGATEEPAAEESQEEEEIEQPKKRKAIASKTVTVEDDEPPRKAIASARTSRRIRASSDEP